MIWVIGEEIWLGMNESYAKHNCWLDHDNLDCQIEVGLIGIKAQGSFYIPNEYV
jgi:hypothetical protein